MNYKVEPGDSFWSISKKFHISIQALEAANPGVQPEHLQVGHELKIPSENGNKPPTINYTVVAGDTLWSIAKAHGVTVDEIKAANPGINPNVLKIGEVIHIPSSTGSHPPTPPSPTPPSHGNGYVQYSGPASNFPNLKSWASWDVLWPENERLLKFHDTDAEIALIKQSIEKVAKESGIDARIILCMILQESAGNLHVPATNNGIRNPGLMQSHNGVDFNPHDPAGSILQMIRDGTEGTKDGDGIKQCLAHYHNYYSALRAYNSGSVNEHDLNDPVGATATYVQSMANRLMGHIWNTM